MKRTRGAKTVIGWREWLVLPDLCIDGIKAKIDTGARTSAIHAFGIRPFARKGEAFVRFSLHPAQHRRHPEIVCEAPVADERLITSSNGEQEHRYVVRTRVALGSAIWPIEMTLTNRDVMGFRMLLGRAAVRNRFVVDPGSSFKLSGKPLGEAAAGRPVSNPRRKAGPK